MFRFLKLRRLVRQLGSTEEPVRRHAAFALGDLGHRGALSALPRLLSDAYPAVRKAAAASLKKLGWEPGTLEESAWYAVALRDWAAVARCGTEAIPALALALTDPDPQVCLGALGTLESMRTSMVRDLVEREVHASAPEVRRKAATVLKHWGEFGAEVLVRQVRHPDADVRFFAVEAVSEGRVENAFGILAAVVEADASARVVLAALLGLAKFGEAGRLALVRACLHANPSVHVQAIEAVCALGDTDDPDTLAALHCVACSDRSAEVVTRALRGLSCFGERARPAWLHAMRHADPSVRLMAVRGMCGSGGARDQDTIESLQRVVREETVPEIVVQAVRALGRLGEKPGPALGVFAAENPLARIEAIEAVHRLGAGDDLDTLEPLGQVMVERTTPEIHARAVQIARRLGQRARSILVHAATQLVGAPQVEAIKALRELGPTGDADTLDALEGAVCRGGPWMQLEGAASLLCVIEPGRPDDRRLLNAVERLLELMERAHVRRRTSYSGSRIKDPGRLVDLDVALAALEAFLRHACPVLERIDPAAAQAHRAAVVVLTPGAETTQWDPPLIAVESGDVAVPLEMGLLSGARPRRSRPDGGLPGGEAVQPGASRGQVPAAESSAPSCPPAAEGDGPARDGAESSPIVLAWARFQRAMLRLVEVMALGRHRACRAETVQALVEAGAQSGLMPGALHEQLKIQLEKPELFKLPLVETKLDVTRLSLPRVKIERPSIDRWADDEPRTGGARLPRSR